MGALRIVLTTFLLLPCFLPLSLDCRCGLYVQTHHRMRPLGLKTKSKAAAVAADDVSLFSLFDFGCFGPARLRVPSFPLLR
jgi:hypothetical protein